MFEFRCASSRVLRFAHLHLLWCFKGLFCDAKLFFGLCLFVVSIITLTEGIAFSTRFTREETRCMSRLRNLQVMCLSHIGVVSTRECWTSTPNAINRYGGNCCSEDRHRRSYRCYKDDDGASEEQTHLVSNVPRPRRPRNMAGIL